MNTALHPPIDFIASPPDRNTDRNTDQNTDRNLGRKTHHTYRKIHPKHLWAGTAGSMAFLLGAMPLAQGAKATDLPSTPTTSTTSTSATTIEPLTLLNPLDLAVREQTADPTPVNPTPVNPTSVITPKSDRGVLTSETIQTGTIKSDRNSSGTAWNPKNQNPTNQNPTNQNVGLSFDLPVLTATPTNPLPGEQKSLAELPGDWWQQGSDSPIAIAIGMAEGTRLVDGSKTAAYYWHEDPGNGANNFGTFSYQHLPSSKTVEVDRQAGGTAKREIAKEEGLAELSDRLQLQRLEKFYAQLQQQATQKNIQLTPLELLNGLDLANQSEAAALSPGGYIDRLEQMRHLLPDQPEEQILEARAWAYWSPDRQDWDAPGLGNTYSSIRRDQERRFAAVQKAWTTYG